MKTKQQKYDEAVARNLQVAEVSPKYKGMTLENAKTRIGIRGNDARYDDVVNTIIKVEGK